MERCQHWATSSGSILQLTSYRLGTAGCKHASRRRARRWIGLWSDAYMSAPIWRFTLAPGLAGRAGMLGVFMPSVDRVGRQFPLTLAIRLDGESPALASHFAAGRTFEHLETIALAALDDDTTRDRLAESLELVASIQRATTSQLASGPGLLTLRAGGLVRTRPGTGGGTCRAAVCFDPACGARTSSRARGSWSARGCPIRRGCADCLILMRPLWASGLAG